ncbi:MAG: MFS transporter [Planktomarina sp.]
MEHAGTDASLKKRIRGWMMFDWATQPFYTLGLTFIFGPYFASVATEFYMGTGLNEQTADARAQTLWSWGQALAGVFVAFLGIFAGAYADSTGRRLPWMIGASLVFVISSWALWYMVPDGSAMIWCLIVFSIAFIAAELALVFTNAILPSLGSPNDIGRISGSGAALGYAGGLIALIIMLLFFFDDGGKTLIGLDPGLGLLDAETREGTRIVGPVIALWYVVFMVPYFLWVRENKVPNRTGGFSKAMDDLKTSLVGMTERRSLFAFMGSQMLYRDALNGLYAFGGVYAALVLNWELMQIALFGIAGAISATIFTWISGKFDGRFGPKPVIRFHVVILIIVCVIIVGMSRQSLLGIPLPEGSIVPDVLFYICGCAIGGAGGGLYSASRSMMVRHTHPERPTEAFGLFALAGKATAFLAPVLIGLFTYLLNDARLGFSPIILLFIGGLFLLRWVEPNGDQTEWSKSSIPAP